MQGTECAQYGWIFETPLLGSGSKFNISVFEDFLGHNSWNIQNFKWLSDFFSWINSYFLPYYLYVYNSVRFLNWDKYDLLKWSEVKW